jgi:RNA polymerase sigma-70 factor, ECF subfamily
MSAHLQAVNADKPHKVMGRQPATDSTPQALMQALTEQRSFLLHLARVQLNDIQLAEDAVQETSLSAWQTFHKFENRSTIRTWLVSILRFKILDAMRQCKRQPDRISPVQIDQELAPLEDGLLFDAHGQWSEEPQVWWQSETNAALEVPDQALIHKQMLVVLQTCLIGLPPKTAQIFLMREYLGFEGNEIAQQLNLQCGHVRVILMRARLALRTCLEQRMTLES